MLELNSSRSERLTQGDQTMSGIVPVLPAVAAVLVVILLFLPRRTPRS